MIALNLDGAHEICWRKPIYCWVLIIVYFQCIILISCSVTEPLAIYLLWKAYQNYITELAQKRELKYNGAFLGKDLHMSNKQLPTFKQLRKWFEDPTYNCNKKVDPHPSKEESSCVAHISTL